MQLTQEYFDQQLKKLATKEDLENFAKKSDLTDFAKKSDLIEFARKDDLKDFATKNDLKSMVAELKDFAKEQTEELAAIIATTIAEPMQQHFDALQNELSLRPEVDKLKQDMTQLKEALHIT